MGDSISPLEKRINQFENMLEELRRGVKEGHELLKDLKKERHEIERLLTHDVREMVNDRSEEIVSKELSRIGPTVREQTNLIYSKIGEQIDKLIAIALGSELSTKPGHKDLRPQLAEKLRRWIEEVINDDSQIGSWSRTQQPSSDLDTP